MCYWKQWPRCRTRVKNLVRLGCPLDAAISAGMSRKGPWHLSRTYATVTRYEQRMAGETGPSLSLKMHGYDPLPGYGPVVFVNRPVRARRKCPW